MENDAVRTTHTPVLLREAMEHLALRPGDTAIDCTLGGGGYTNAMLEEVGDRGHVCAIDRDPTAIAAAQLLPWATARAKQITFIHSDFRDLVTIAAQAACAHPRAIVADLGFSSLQLGASNRGFSFTTDGPLDMRLDPTSEQATAAAVLQGSTRKEIEHMLRTYGEEPAAARLAQAMVDQRKRKPIRTTHELAALIERVIPRRGRIHPATRTFQALRIAVNDELGALTDVIPQMLNVVDVGGRIAIVSFHSLEDRIVKQRFRAAERQGIGRMLTKRPLQPTASEVERNPRSRSAKLRVIERIR
ncbi:16S rRNA (cytosine(1402)-N(4))-methyltransferase RsmH [Candidatus Uhrbacteria bacterium]|nr:16S rRNA (cytosine(1402)-N(4))-methyltransferase RsmH [Candidatus Uhrbacteria bacterium]